MSAATTQCRVVDGDPACMRRDLPVRRGYIAMMPVHLLDTLVF